ncbi:hypothetical protein [Streptomyces sp. NPDC049040]|uniref:hypothetical protein n=1 Tax=Streptomyces sp. NPDC049040 TaxID=3365593 RepID=UPI003716D65A
MRHRTALLAAGTALLLLTGTTAATAAGSGTQPASHAPAKPGDKIPGVSAERLERALRDVKQMLGPDGGRVTDPAVVARVAKDLGVSTAKARAILRQFFGGDEVGPKPPGDKGGKGGKGDKDPGKGGKGGKDGGKGGKGGKDRPGGPAAVITAKDLAKALGVPQARAQAALDALQKLAKGPRGTVDENSPAFAAIAAKLGVTPQQLTKVLTVLKEAAGKPGAPKPGTPKP